MGNARMNVLDMTISRVSRISMALSLMLLASWVWFNFLTQPQATNLFVTSLDNQSMFQKISLGGLRLPGNNVLQAREGGATIADLPLLPGSELPVRQMDSVEILGNSALGNSSSDGLNNGLGSGLNRGLLDGQSTGQSGVTNFANAEVQGGPAPLLPSAQRQNIQIADLPFLVNAPPAAELDEGEQIVIAAPSGRLTVNPFAPIYVEEEAPVQRRTPVVNSAPSSNNQTASQRTSNQARAAVVEEPLKPKIEVEVAAVPTPRPVLPPPTRQSNLPASMATASLAAKPSLLRAPIRSNYYNEADVPEPVVIEVPAEVVEEVVVAEPVKLDRSRLTGIRIPVNGAASAQPAAQINTRSYTGTNANNNGAGALPSVAQAPASPTLATRLPQAAGVRPALTVPALQPIGLAQAQLIGRRNVPVVEAAPVEEVVEEVEAPQLRPVQIALRVPEPVAPAPVVQAPVIQAPVVQVPVVQEEIVEEVVEEPAIVEEIVEEPVVEEVDVIEIPTSQPYIATVSNTLDVAQPEAAVDTTTVQAVASGSSEAVEASDVVGASLVASYVRDNNLSFTGAILGPVSVAIFQSRMGSFHVPIGEMIPDTEIRLTNVKRHEVELRQGSESHIIYLDLGQ